MIMINDTSLSFANMGLFDLTGEWIHPTVTVETYELIFVTEGEVHLREGSTVYHLRKGDLLLLEPYTEHGGTETSHGRTSFYWLHFKTDRISAFPFAKRSSPPFARTERAMVELMQRQQASRRTVADLLLGQFLMEGTLPVERRSKTAHEIAEYIRIHASEPMTVEAMAQRFGYAPDHLSRLLRHEFGKSAKAMLLEQRLSYIESILLNTNAPLREVAQQCGFEDENMFVKFFKYHEQITPTQFRNEFFRFHMNVK